MKICLIHDTGNITPDASSVPGVIYSLSKILVEMANEAIVLEENDEKRKEEEFLDGIKIIKLERTCTHKSPMKIYKSPFSSLCFIFQKARFALKIHRYLKTAQNFDIVHVFSPFTALFLIFLNPGLREKMVYSYMAGEFALNLSGLIKPPLYIRVLPSPFVYLMKKVKKTVVFNEELSSKIILRYKVAPEKIKAIPLGMNINKLDLSIELEDEERVKLKEKYQLAKDSNLVLFVNTIMPRKGAKYLVKAAEILINKLRCNNIQFLLCGSTTIDKKYTEEIIDFIKSKKLEGKVKLIGYVSLDELKRLYTLSDIVAVTSLEEGFGSSAAEAMGSGKALVATKVSGSASMLIKDGYNGLLVEPANERELAEKIKFLIDNPEERERMGWKAKEVLKEFDWKRISEKYLGVYEEVRSK